MEKSMLNPKNIKRQMKIKCKRCGVEFEGRDGQQFCSTTCRNAYNYQRRKHGAVIDITAKEVDGEVNAETEEETEEETPIDPETLTDREKKIIDTILKDWFLTEVFVDCENPTKVAKFLSSMAKKFPIESVYRLSVSWNENFINNK